MILMKEAGLVGVIWVGERDSQTGSLWAEKTIFHFQCPL